MDETFIEVQNQPTYVTKCGEPDPNGILLLIIPGNPGIAGYYETFQNQLWECSGKKVPVWCVSHVGHVEKQQFNPDWYKDCYSLEGQISHKLHFIQENIPKTTKLILIGHSIGAYIILELLDKLQEQVIQSCLLFPTIEYIASAPSGPKLVHLLKYMRWLAFGPLFALQYLPLWLKNKILEFFVFPSDSADFAVRASLNLFSPFCVSNVLYLANDEFQQVLQANHDALHRHLPNIMIYYGNCDNWCPLAYAHRMKMLYPEANIIICEKGFLHDFVIDSGPEMGTIVYEWLTEKCDQFK